MAQYDVIIIGGGPGGYNAAIRAGQIDTAALLSAEFPLAELGTRFAALAADREGLIKAVVRP